MCIYIYIYMYIDIYIYIHIYIWPREKKSNMKRTSFPPAPRPESDSTCSGNECALVTAAPKCCMQFGIWRTIRPTGQGVWNPIPKPRPRTGARRAIGVPKKSRPRRTPPGIGCAKPNAQIKNWNLSAQANLSKPTIQTIIPMAAGMPQPQAPDSWFPPGPI